MSLEHHEIETLTHLIRKLVMSDIADDVKSILAAVTALQTAVAAIATPTVDLTPVTTAIAAVQASVDGIAADLVPTPPVA